MKICKEIQSSDAEKHISSFYASNGILLSRINRTVVSGSEAVHSSRLYRIPFVFLLAEVKYSLPVLIQIRFIRRHFTPKIFSFYIPVVLVTTSYIFLLILIKDLLKLTEVEQVQGECFASSFLLEFSMTFVLLNHSGFMYAFNITMKQ